MTHVQTRIILLAGATKYKEGQSNISVLFDADILLQLHNSYSVRDIF